MTRFALAAVLMTLAGAAAAQTKPNPAGTIGSADAKVRLQTLGYKNVHDLRRDADGQWVGKATRGNVEKSVMVPSRGNVVAR
ncbi:MAG: hypothetical protein EPO55_18975 [Reyranella sp.]|uniref:hypothetical protein n=1 Tax=Reyranella sp. TaxID=1929291 RepID=UPI0012267472|nr:hypothetical protein [Reyranella sp.]TAJ37305.1 MAG: hypothetical protein EPO55_18975 [Reyranella sp.]